MDEIKWLEIAINTTPDRLDEVTAKLTAAGMDNLVIEDEGEFQTFLEENRQYWDFVDESLQDRMKGVTRVKFYVTDDADGHAKLAQYTQGLDCEYTQTPLVENDWAYSWQKYYKPQEVGERLFIVPEWNRNEPVPVGRVPVYLNPGLTFGTGSHATTQLCLETIEERPLKGYSVLDFGCGSGILSIAALALGAEKVRAFDIDPKAVSVAYENAALNGIDKSVFQVQTCNVLEDMNVINQLKMQRFDMILANIIPDVIMPLSVHLKEMLAYGGTFICSGIISSRAQEVRDCLFSNGLLVTKKKEKDGWVAMEARWNGFFL